MNKSTSSSLNHMITALSREITEDELTFNGVNSITPMVAIELARKINPYPINYLNIAGGFNPTLDTLPISTSSSSLLEGSSVIFPNEEFYDLCARGGIDLAFLGAAQIDSKGRTNVSAIGPYDNPKVRLPGGGGASVIMPTAKRVVVWRTKHDIKTFPDQLDFITSSGNVDAVITPLCVFRKVEGELQIESVYSTSTLEEVKSNTGFSLENSADPYILQPTTEEEKLIKELDPNGVRFLDWEKQ